MKIQHYFRLFFRKALQIFLTDVKIIVCRETSSSDGESVSRKNNISEGYMLHEVKDNVENVAEDAAKAVSEAVESSKKSAKRTFNVIIGSVIYVIALLVVYLIVSLCVKNFWSVSWLIPVTGILVGGMGLAIFYAIKSSMAKKYLLMRILIASAITSGILATYFLFSALADNAWSLSWILFLFLPVTLTGADLIACIGTENKLTLVSLEAFIIVAATMTYVILGITGFMPWHPGWLLPVLALLVTVVITLVALKNKIFKKK